MDDKYLHNNHSIETLTSLDTEIEDTRNYLKEIDQNIGNVDDRYKQNNKYNIIGEKKNSLEGYVSPKIFLEYGRVGEYKITSSLGKGSSSKVRLGISSSGEKVAIKIVGRKTAPKTYSKESQERRDERTYREVIISTLMKHPHIVRLKNFYYNELHFFLIFEYVDGVMLLDLITKKERKNYVLSENEARRYFNQILSALSYLHSYSIVHRDLKIENVLIDNKGNAKLIDFGLSNFFDERRYLNTFCGSLYFAAPELLKGIKYRGPEIDVWSLGVILYVLLQGRVPFDDQNIHQLHLKIKKGELKIYGQISDEAKFLLKKMICTDTEIRYGLEDVIKSEWVNDKKGNNRLEINYNSYNNYFLDRKISKLHENAIRFLQLVAGKQFKELKNDIIQYKKISKASLNSTIAINRPSVSLYYLFIESLEDSTVDYKNNIEKINNLKIKDYKEKSRDEIIHKFISLIFEKDRKKSFSRYFQPTVFVEESENEEYKSLDSIRNDSNDNECGNNDNSFSSCITNHPKVKNTFIKGIFNHLTFKTSLDHTNVRKSVTEFLAKENIGYEIKEKSYNCSVRSNTHECNFKLSLYYNLLFRKYFLSLKRLSGSAELYKNVKETIKSMINTLDG
ncbi:Serine/threonine protein kinase Kin1 [Spraguea lophii 42_110]|uniref:Serine/threonine protein kinase Kin1 n=1 Tax=Spraguea lophii (strain 42_110) TaxID=1358809 RepID=S7W840_SPRLO|nr:Serine/threonine protein kinase Kin1 [Spraguea lophii 42_110]